MSNCSRIYHIHADSEFCLGVKGGGYPEDGLYDYNNSRTKDILGIEFRGLKESIIDTVKSLEAEGA